MPGLMRNTWPIWPALALLVFFYITPLTLLLPESLTIDDRTTFQVYGMIATDPYYWKVLVRSFWLSLLSTVICLLIGYPVAYYLVRLVHPQFRRFAYMVIIAPLFTSAVIRALAWILILGRQGMANDALIALGLIEIPVRLLYTETAIVIGLVYITVPFMVLTVAAVLENIDPALENAAQDLGASPMVTFWKITWPLTIPGVVAGCFLVFALCLSSYVTPALLGGGRTKVMAMLIFEQFLRVFNWPLGAAIASALLVITLCLMWAYNRVLAKRVVGGREGIEAAL